MTIENGIDDTGTNEEVTLESIQRLLEDHSHRDSDTIVSMKGWLEKHHSPKHDHQLQQYKKFEHVNQLDDGPDYESEEEFAEEVEMLLNDALGG